MDRDVDARFDNFKTIGYICQVEIHNYETEQTTQEDVEVEIEVEDDNYDNFWSDIGKQVFKHYQDHEGDIKYTVLNCKEIYRL